MPVVANHVGNNNPLRALSRLRTAVVLSLLGLAGCATVPPSQPENLCAIFQEKDGWYAAATASYRHWRAPIPVMMSIIYQESSFRADAAPPRTHLLWVIPWTRPTSAYGYSQAIDGTWDWYVRETGNSWADRDSFADSIDFVGWYIAKSHDMLGLAKADAYSQYLAYHEGQAGYRRGNYRGKGWLITVAHRVAARANRYRQQLQGCRARLVDDSGWW